MVLKSAIVALALLLPSAVGAQSLQPTKEDIREAIESDPYSTYREQDLDILIKELQAALSDQEPDAAADRVGAQYGFPRAAMRRFVRAWVITRSRQYDENERWKPAVRRAIHEVTPALRATPLGLALLAETLDQVSECSGEDYERLMAGSTDPAADAYVIAVNATCTANFARAMLADVHRPAPALIRQVDWGGLPMRDMLPLYAWLTSPAGLAHVREGDRRTVAVILWQDYLAELFGAGLDRQALAAFDTLPEDVRTGVVAPHLRPLTRVVVDGIPVTFNADRDTFYEPSAPILQLVEAMAMAGREDEARALLATLPGLAQAKAAAACDYNRRADSESVLRAGGTTKCPETGPLPMAALPIDHLLNSPDVDPYPIAEALLSDLSGSSRTRGAVLCRVFPKDIYPDICRDASYDDAWREPSFDEEEVPLAEAAIERVIPNFLALRASLVGERATPAPPRDDLWSRTTVAAKPAAFSEAPIPLRWRGAGKAPNVNGLAALPPGFDPVRVERAGERVVAISVSQTYDPSGEVSQGGYWVHVSQDGGKSWQAPLYTGLADRFPYVVKPTSRLPLIAGDALQLAVDIAEIDTATITYPPVALRTRREAKDLYLTIPLDDLRRDSDSNGLSDIAERHLLLDGAGARKPTPFIVGSDVDSDCRVAPSDEKLAFIALLSRFNGRSEAALVEPVNRPPGQIGLGWSRATAAVDQPIFLQGDWQDYTCLASRWLIIVYSQADLEAMRPLSPDFHALDVPRIVFNRARDRGYVHWSAGWTGGIYGLHRVDGKWRFFVISAWIS